MTNLLKNGSKGDAVSQLQSQLSRLGYSIEADGKFGPATKATVEEFQAAFGYDADGIVGSGTSSLIEAQLGHGWAVTGEGAIKRALEAQGKVTDKGSLAGADLRRNLKKGVEGGDVRYLQRRLAVLGFAVPTSGVFDAATDTAVRSVQEAHGYTVDGVVGSGTHTLINAQIGFGWSAATA